MGASSNRRVGLEFRKRIVDDADTPVALLSVSSSSNDGTTAVHEWVDLTPEYDSADELADIHGHAWTTLLAFICKQPATEAGFARCRAALDRRFGAGKSAEIDALDDAQGVWMALEATARSGMRA